MLTFDRKDFNLYKNLLDESIKYQERYIESEKFILKLIKMPWYKSIYYKLFKMDEDILEFIRSRKKFEK